MTVIDPWVTQFERLQVILSDMNIPHKRKTDLQWLHRNIHFQNNGHKDYKEAVLLLDSLIQQPKQRRKNDLHK